LDSRQGRQARQGLKSRSLICLFIIHHQ
jgi:hypothetical protein